MVFCHVKFVINKFLTKLEKIQPSLQINKNKITFNKSLVNWVETHLSQSTDSLRKSCSSNYWEACFAEQTFSEGNISVYPIDNSKNVVGIWIKSGVILGSVQWEAHMPFVMCQLFLWLLSGQRRASVLCERSAEAQFDTSSLALLPLCWF
jgi:hypothetical protein